MSYSIPDTAKRFSACAFVQNAELSAIGRDEVIRHSIDDITERAIREIIRDSITSDSYQWFKSQTLRLDVYVVKPADLERMLREAFIAGSRDIGRWGMLYPEPSRDRLPIPD